MIEVSDGYVGSYDYIELHRGEFPTATRVVDDRAFCARLAAIDAQAEVVWNPRRQKWALYRVVELAAGPSGDFLRHEFDLPHDWTPDYLFARMRRTALIRPGETSMDPEREKQQWMKKLAGRMHERDTDLQRRWDDCTRNVCNNMLHYFCNGKTSDGRTRRKVRNKKPSQTIRQGTPRVFHTGLPSIVTA